MTRSARLCIVTDIHHGNPSFSMAGPAALSLLEDFRRFVADAKPDAVLDLGDRIADESREKDIVLAREVAEAFAPIAARRFHLDGNHDRDNLDLSDNDAILGRTAGNETVDIGDWRLVVWRADPTFVRPHGFNLRDTDLGWLAATVSRADRPLAIVSHVPVSGQSQVGNRWFHNNEPYATYPTAERVRGVLRQTSVPIVWISGHVHWNTLTLVDGIAHLTLQALTETFTTAGEPAGAFALLELSDDVLWRVHGRDSFSWSTKASALARRWLPAMPDFRQVVGSKLYEVVA